jgi:hypothetical protein
MMASRDIKISDLPAAFFQAVMWAPYGLMVKVAPDEVCVTTMGSLDMVQQKIREFS